MTEKKKHILFELFPANDIHCISYHKIQGNKPGFPGYK